MLRVWSTANLTLSGNQQQVAFDLAVFLVLYGICSLKDSHIQLMRSCLLPTVEKMCQYDSHSLVSAYFEKTAAFQQNHDPQVLAFLHYIAFERLGVNSLLLLCSLIPSVMEFVLTAILLVAEGLYALAGLHLLSAALACTFSYLYARFVMAPKFFKHLAGLNDAYPALFQHVARLPLARNCGAVKAEQAEAGEWLKELSKKQLASNSSQQLTFVIPAISYTLFFALMLWFSAETISADKLVVALLYLFTTYIPLQHVADSLNPILGNEPSFKQLWRYLYDETSFDLRYKDARLKASVPIREDEEPLLALQDVSYKHPGQAEFAIRNVSFELRPGQAALVVGKSGQGKTTLVKLIHGLGKLQDEGTIHLSGVDNHEISPAGLAKHTYMVSQNTVIFGSVRQRNEDGTVGKERPATVADNIRYVRPDASDEGLQEVAQRVGLDDSTLNRPVGYGGGSLSGGEKKRVALARALLMQARVIICDEITAGLDPAGQREVMLAVEDLRSKGAAILFVTHRPGVADEYISFNLTLEVKDGIVTSTAATLKELAEQGKLSQLSMMSKAHCDTCTCADQELQQPKL